jgi:hypothetical protein
MFRRNNNNNNLIKFLEPYFYLIVRDRQGTGLREPHFCFTDS